MDDSRMLLIRPAAVSDVPLLLKFSRELAEYERQPDAMVITEETLTRDGFGLQPKFRGLIAEWDGEAIGYALFFGIYSSVKGPGIFLEDLFVREAFRGRGIGRALLSAVARIAREEGSYGIRWEVLGWNESAIKFYRLLGCEFHDDCRQILLQSDALDRLADGETPRNPSATKGTANAARGDDALCSTIGSRKKTGAARPAREGRTTRHE